MRISHIEYADESDICDYLCKYHIGDTVTLLKKIKYRGKTYKAGTPFIIKAIKLNKDFSNLLYKGILRIFKDELKIKNWNADIAVFNFTLLDTDNKVEIECGGEYLDKIKRKKPSIYRTVSIEQQLGKVDFIMNNATKTKK